MNNLNTVLIEGQLTRDPSLSPTPAQTQMCRLSIANNRYHLDKNGKWVQEPSYFTVHVYGNVAGACVTYLKKGRGVRIVGRLKQFSWLDQGFKREKVYILAEHIEFQPSKKSEPLKEPEREPGEFITKANLHEIEDYPEETPASVPNPEPSDLPVDVPDCTIEGQEAEAEIQQGFEQEDFEQAC